MKVAFDTCVLVDIMQKNEWFLDSFAAFDVAMLRRHNVFVSAAATTDLVYVLKRRSGFHTEEVMPLVFEMFDFLDVLKSDCLNAYESKMPDYEDAVFAYSSQRNGVDLIVTRNKKDFATAPVPVMTPSEYVAEYKPADISYDLQEFGIDEG